MSVSGELLCSFELLKPLDSTALKNHIKKGRNKRNSLLSSPVSSTLVYLMCQEILAVPAWIPRLAFRSCISLQCRFLTSHAACFALGPKLLRLTMNKLLSVLSTYATQHITLIHARPQSPTEIDSEIQPQPSRCYRGSLSMAGG